ncbi:MAG TPA: cytochrome c peroxidase, partial [Candidatus Bathyarchaeia archaeon]|nr:cytochrome c peroxidase [Candidatus Bathyarchaeia archaeon]
VPLYARAGDDAAKPAPPLTEASAFWLGPVKLGVLPPPPVPPGNPQTERKILLGKQLYFDTRLSKDNTISCATCHSPKLGWSDEGPTSKGIAGQRGGRRAPPASNSAYNPLQFWDGRSASLAEQSKGPIQNPIEMGNTHEVMIRTVGDIPGYVEEFKEVFGTTPITIDQVADAIAAFERTIVTTDSPFDRFVQGDEAALTCLEKKGLEIFNGKGHCTCCHWGPNFTDGRFHNLGVPPTDPAKPDYGRSEITKNPADKGAFKTPTLRDVGLRAPYLHTGGEKTLEDVIVFYNKGGGLEDPNLDPMMVPLGLSTNEINALVAFLKHGLTSLNPEVAGVEPIPASQLPQ